MRYTYTVKDKCPATLDAHTSSPQSLSHFS
jgi:hypothetical protein